MVMAGRETDSEAAGGVTAERLAEAVADPRFPELHRLSKEIAGILDALGAAAHNGDVRTAAAQEAAYLSRSLQRQRVLVAALGLDGPSVDG